MMMMNEPQLKKLIASLQNAIANGGMNLESIDASINELSKLNYKYDYKRFPVLVNTESFIDTSGDSPSNLAESLLWKLGKWPSYKRFAANYTSEDSKATKTDVVFFAFAKHLKDKDNPIYDQHAIRALWAICGKLTVDEKRKCKSLLFDGKDKWKQAGSGGETIDCYELFVKHINDLVSVSDGASKGEIEESGLTFCDNYVDKHRVKQLKEAPRRMQSSICSVVGLAIASSAKRRGQILQSHTKKRCVRFL